MNKNPYRHLAVSIILRAVADVFAGKGGPGTERSKNYHSSLKFFRSDWFEFLASGAGIDPQKVRSCILDAKYRKKMQAEYKKYSGAHLEYESYATLFKLVPGF